MVKNLDELVKVLEMLGETKGAMPMPRSLGKGRPSGWQKNVERMLDDYNRSAANAVSNIEIPRGLQTASGGAVEAARSGVPSVNVRTAADVPSTNVLPRAKPKPKFTDILAEYTELPPEIPAYAKAKGFSDDLVAKMFPSTATLEAQLANTTIDAPTAGVGPLLKKVTPKIKAALPSLDALLGKMKPALDMSKLGSIDKVFVKEADIAAKEAAANTLKQGLEQVGKEAGEKAAEQAAKEAIKKGSKLGKYGKIGMGLAAAGLLGAYIMGNDGQGLEEGQPVAADTQPSGPSMQDMLLAQLMNSGTRSSELDKVLEAMASQVRINAANAERQNRVANAIAMASQQVSDKL